MANPLLIPIAFATNGAKNIIQKIRQAGQGEDAATWDGGWSGRTMIPKDAGGLPPDGRDFNGLFNVVSEHLIHRQDGEQIKFDPVKVTEIGGYPKGALIQSDDTETTYRSLVNNNAFNPNTQPLTNRWEIYAGKGSTPIATSTTAGVMKVINNLVSTDTASALSALQGKILNDSKVNIKDIVNNLSTNDTNKPISAAQGKALNDLKLNADEFSRSNSQNGWYKMPNGMIMQWGKTPTIADEATISVSFNIRFSGTPRSIQLTENRKSTSSINSSHVCAINPTSTGFQIYHNSTQAVSTSCDWLAIGF